MPQATTPVAALIDRIRGEYLEMPGLQLTLAQAQRLWHLDAMTCEALLGALVDARFLRRSAKGQYSLLGSGEYQAVR